MELLIIAGIAIVIIFVVFRIFKALIKWVLIIVIILGALAFFTNPKESAHRQSLKDAIQDLPVKVREKSVSVDDYKIFSITKVKVRGKEKIVGIGAFGRVWHFNDINERLRKK